MLVALTEGLNTALLHVGLSHEPSGFSFPIHFSVSPNDCENRLLLSSLTD